MFCLRLAAEGLSEEASTATRGPVSVLVLGGPRLVAVLCVWSRRAALVPAELLSLW